MHLMLPLTKEHLCNRQNLFDRNIEKGHLYLREATVYMILNNYVVGSSL